MPQRKSAGWFFARFLLYFVLLMIPWPGLGETYGAFYRATANVMFCSFGDHGLVRIEPLDDTEVGRDMRLNLENTLTHAKSSTDGRTRLMGYQPTAFVAALILATPLPWPRRWKALILGMIGVNVYVVLRLFLLLTVFFSGENALALFSPGTTLRSVLSLAHWLFIVSFSGSFVFPLGIWFLASFRRSDWALLVGHTGHSSAV